MRSLMIRVMHFIKTDISEIRRKFAISLWSLFGFGMGTIFIIRQLSPILLLSRTSFMAVSIALLDIPAKAFHMEYVILSPPPVECFLLLCRQFSNSSNSNWGIPSFVYTWRLIRSSSRSAGTWFFSSSRYSWLSSSTYSRVCGSHLFLMFLINFHAIRVFGAAFISSMFLL